MLHIFTVVIDCARFPTADSGKFECVYPGPIILQEAKSSVELLNLEIPGNFSGKHCKLQRDTELDTQSDTGPNTEPDTQLVTELDTQMESMFNKSEYEFNTESKVALEYKTPVESISERNICLNDEMETYKIESGDSVTFVSKQIKHFPNEIRSDQSARDDSKRSKTSNFMSLTSSNLLRKVHDAGTQFARLLLSYFLIHLQSTAGISTLPNVVLESQKLRDSLCLRMSSPSMFFATSGYEAEKLS